MTQVERITVEATVNAPLAKVWNAWNTPGDISGTLQTPVGIAPAVKTT